MEFVSCQKSLVNLLMIKSIHCILRFMNKHGDSELDSMLLNTVPPCDITRVALFNAALNKWEKEACLPWPVSPNLFSNKVWHMTCHEYILRSSHHVSPYNLNLNGCLGGVGACQTSQEGWRVTWDFMALNNQLNMFHNDTWITSHKQKHAPKKHDFSQGFHQSWQLWNSKKPRSTLRRIFLSYRNGARNLMNTAYGRLLVTLLIKHPSIMHHSALSPLQCPSCFAGELGCQIFGRPVRKRIGLCGWFCQKSSSLRICWWFAWSHEWCDRTHGKHWIPIVSHLNLPMFLRRFF